MVTTRAMNRCPPASMWMRLASLLPRPVEMSVWATMPMSAREMPILAPVTAPLTSDWMSSFQAGRVSLTAKPATRVTMLAQKAVLAGL